MKANPIIKISLTDLESFLYSCDSCISDVDVPIVLESLLEEAKLPVPWRIKEAVKKSQERIYMGDY